VKNDHKDRPEQAQKAIRLVEFLTRVASLRAKPVRDVEEYERVLWLSDVPRDPGCFTQAWGRDGKHQADEWLEVQGRREPALPPVPEECKDWVDQPALLCKADLPELFQEVARLPTDIGGQAEASQPSNVRTERLEDFPGIRDAWNQYVEGKWLPWAEAHAEWEKLHGIYSALFAIHQRQLGLGEEYELLLGLGLLTWQTPTGQRVRRHLIVADCVLEFEAGAGRFVVRPHAEGANL
jgi:hypothetical protein